MKRLTPGSLRMQHIQSVVKAVQELSLKQPTLTLPSWVYTIASECPVLNNYGSRNLSLLRIQMYQHQCFFHATRLQTCCHPSTLKVVLTAYFITGCDTVSYPFRIGKKRALKCALKNRDVLETMANYGEPDGCLQPMPKVLQCARKFYFALYERRDCSGTLDELRCHLFITKKGDLRSLPCTEDAFTFHAQRALHQLVIYKRATQPDPLLPDALEFGRYLHDGCLISKRMTKSAKPYIAKIYCKCKNGKCGNKCPCHHAGLECNIGCICSGDPLKCSRFTGE